MTRIGKVWRWLMGGPPEAGTALHHVEVAQVEQDQAEAHLAELRRRLLHVEAELVERGDWSKKVKP